MRRFKHMVIILALMILATACNTKGSVTVDDVNQFIDDSERIYTILETAYQEERKMSSEENNEFRDYTTNYDKEGDFQKSADDPSISLVVTNASLMQLMIGKEDDQSKKDYADYKSDFLEELNAVKQKQKEN